MSTIITDGNPKACAVKLDYLLLNDLPYIVIKPDTADRSAFAQSIFSQLPGVNEIFIRKSTSNGTTISLNSGPDWTDAEKNSAQQIIDLSLSENGFSIDEAAYKEELIKVRSGTPTEGLVHKFFNQVMQPMFQKHGGDMDIQRVVENPDNTVDVELTAMGSCDSCGSAVSLTVAYAQAQLGKVFDAVGDKIGGKTFGRITVVNLDRSPT